MTTVPSLATLVVTVGSISLRNWPARHPLTDRVDDAAT